MTFWIRLVRSRQLSISMREECTMKLSQHLAAHLQLPTLFSLHTLWLPCYEEISPRSFAIQWRSVTWQPRRLNRQRLWASTQSDFNCMVSTSKRFNQCLNSLLWQWNCCTREQDWNICIWTLQQTRITFLRWRWRRILPMPLEFPISWSTQRYVAHTSTLSEILFSRCWIDL